jgi:hypothetical protein
MTGNPLRSPLLALAALACAEAEPEDESTPFSTWETPEPWIIDTGPYPVDPACVGALELEPGTGGLAFEPLEPGGPLTIFQDAAGFRFANFAARVHGSSGVVLSIEPRLVTEEHPVGGEDQPFNGVALDAWDADTCVGDLYGQRIFIDDYLPTDQTYHDYVCGLHGQPATLSYTLEDVDTGEAASVSIEVTLAVDPATNDCP